MAQLGKLKDYLGEILLAMIAASMGALFTLMVAIGTSQIVTWGQTNTNTENIAENREDHESAGHDRFKRSDAERMEDRQEIKNKAMRDEVVKLIKEVWFLKGKADAGH